MKHPELFAEISAADNLLDSATPEQLKDLARLLALHLGFYQSHYGTVSEEEHQRLLDQATPGGGLTAMLKAGNDTLIRAMLIVLEGHPGQSAAFTRH